MESAAFGFQYGQGETTIIITSLVETAVFSHYIRFFKIFQGSTQILKKYAETPKQNTPDPEVGVSPKEVRNRSVALVCVNADLLDLDVV